MPSSVSSQDGDPWELLDEQLPGESGPPSESASAVPPAPYVTSVAGSRDSNTKQPTVVRTLTSLPPPSCGRRAKTWKIDYFNDGIDYTTETIDGKKGGCVTFKGPSRPGTMTAALQPDGNACLGEAFISLPGTEGEDDTLIRMGTDVKTYSFCCTPTIGYIGRGGSDLPDDPRGESSFTASHAIVYHAGTPSQAGASRVDPLYIPPH